MMNSECSLRLWLKSREYRQSRPNGQFAFSNSTGPGKSAEPRGFGKIGTKIGDERLDGEKRSSPEGICSRKRCLRLLVGSWLFGSFRCRRFGRLRVGGFNAEQFDFKHQ